jgi:hypothetical protein
MIIKNGFFVDKTGIDRKVLPTGFAEEAMDFLAITEFNNRGSGLTSGTYIFFHMPHICEFMLSLQVEV